MKTVARGGILCEESMGEPVCDLLFLDPPHPVSELDVVYDPCSEVGRVYFLVVNSPGSMCQVFFFFKKKEKYNKVYHFSHF